MDEQLIRYPADSCYVEWQKQVLLLHKFHNFFSRTTWVSWYQKSKTSLDLNDARDDEVLGCNGISWTTRKQSAPCSREITTPTPHHSIFTGRMLFQCNSSSSSEHIAFLFLGFSLFYLYFWFCVLDKTDQSGLECMQIYPLVSYHNPCRNGQATDPGDADMCSATQPPTSKPELLNFYYMNHTHTHIRLTALFRDYLGEPVPER